MGFSRAIFSGVSKKGKNRIREHGNNWEIIAVNASVPCLKGKSGVLLRAKDGYLRWFADEDDPDFKKN